MAKGKGHMVPHRRRAEQKTNYRKRVGLLKSGKPRLVVRRSLNNTVCQIVDYQASGDVCRVTANSSELKKLGWNASTGNIPAAYLTGMLCAKRAVAKGIKEAILDIGLSRSTKGGRIYAALKGAVDAGLSVPHSDTILPDQSRLTGSHIAAYAERLKKDDQAAYKKRFSLYLKSKTAPESLPKHMEEVKEKLLKSK